MTKSLPLQAALVSEGSAVHAGSFGPTAAIPGGKAGRTVDAVNDKPYQQKRAYIWPQYAFG